MKFQFTWLSGILFTEMGSGMTGRFYEKIPSAHNHILITSDFIGSNGSEWLKAARIALDSSAEKQKFYISPGYHDIHRSHLNEIESGVIKQVEALRCYKNAVAVSRFGGDPVTLIDGIGHFATFGFPDVKHCDFDRENHNVFEIHPEFRESNGKSDILNIAFKLEKEILADFERKLHLASNKFRKVIISSLISPYYRLLEIDANNKYNLRGRSEWTMCGPIFGKVLSECANQHPEVEYIVLVDGAFPNTGHNSFTAGNVRCFISNRRTRNSVNALEIPIHNFEITI
jgi:hypothetical protein